MKLMVQKLCAQAVLPARATPGSAGYDLCACIDAPLTIAPGSTQRIPTGLALAPDTDEVVLLLYARSGLATKHGIAMANGVGVVDSDYRGEVQIPLINLGTEEFTVLPGMRVAQLVVTPVLLPELLETTFLPESERQAGGFGSTGQTSASTPLSTTGE